MDTASALLVGVLLGSPGGAVDMMAGYAWDSFAIKAHAGIGQDDSGGVDGWGAMVEGTFELRLFDGVYFEPGVAVAYTDLGRSSNDGGMGDAAIYGAPVVGVTLWGVHISGGIALFPYYIHHRETLGLESVLFPVLQFGWQGRFDLGR